MAIAAEAGPLELVDEGRRDSSRALDKDTSWPVPGVLRRALAPGGDLAPRYDLMSSVTTGGVTTATGYAEPALGLPTAAVVAPGQLALTMATAYVSTPE